MSMGRHRELWVASHLLGGPGHVFYERLTDANDFHAQVELLCERPYAAIGAAQR